MEYKEIRAVFDNNTIRVYQAYNEIIAKEAVNNGTFGKNFKLDRMTWIKPSFLWMMYRCGWGKKENQTSVSRYFYIWVSTFFKLYKDYITLAKYLYI